MKKEYIFQYSHSSTMTMKCSECDCVMDLCKDVDFKHCMRCTKQICCCVTIHKPNKQNSILTFFHHTRTLFAAALGIEILCISAAEIGENSAFFFFGYHLQGIILGYIMGYAAAGFTTFMTLLGRYDLANTRIDSCCSLLEQQSHKGFLPNLIITFKNFGVGISKLSSLHRQSNIKHILKISRGDCMHINSRNSWPHILQTIHATIHSPSVTSWNASSCVT
jgi:hypothetical protein